MRASLLVLMLFASQALAVDVTTIFEIDQAYGRDGNEKSELSVQFELDHDFDRLGSLTSIVEIRAVGPDQLEPGEPHLDLISNASERWSINNYLEVELRELYLDRDITIGNLEGQLRLGKQQVVWGQADGLRLLDVVNPIDFREFILPDYDDSRIPLWMVNLELYLGAGDLQLLWIPDTSMHNLPGPGSSFEFTAPFTRIPEHIPFIVEPFDRPNDLGDSDFGIRFSTFRGGWDLAFNHLYRYDDFPYFEKKLGADGLTLTPKFGRTHTLGASLSNAFGDFVLRTEVAFNTDKYLETNSLQDDSVGSTRELGYVLGLDWTGLTDTMISLQVFQSILLDDDDFVRDDTDTHLTLLARRYFMNESLLIKILWIYHQNEGDNLFRLSTTYDVTSELQLEAYVDMFSGNDDKLFGQFDDQDRYGLRLSYGF